MSPKFYKFVNQKAENEKKHDAKSFQKKKFMN